MLPPDRDFYRGAYSRAISRQQGGQGEAYETTYKIKKDLKIANRADIGEEFNKLVKDKKAMTTMLIDYVNEMVKHDLDTGRIGSSDVMNVGKAYLKQYLGNFGSLSTNEQFTAMSRGLTISTPVFRDRFIKGLKEKGFDGYIDEAGVGGLSSPREGVEPLVVFDAEKVLEKRGSLRINPYNMIKAQQRYNQWAKFSNSKFSRRTGKW